MSFLRIAALVCGVAAATALAVASGCVSGAIVLPTVPSIAADGSFRLGLYNLNLKDWGESSTQGADQARRIQNMADLLLQGAEANGRRWDIVAMNEGAARNLWNTGNYGGVWQAVAIPCLINGFSVLAVDCLAAHLENSPGRPLSFAAQHGEIGMIARSGVLELVPGTYQHRYLGNNWFNTLRREVVGGRFRVLGTNLILPVYSTHISTSDSTDFNRKQQIEDLLTAVEEWWEPGDLTPVIAGDFNFGVESDNLYGLISPYYQEAGALFGRDVIEHVWIGRLESFYGAIGEVVPVRYDFLTEFDDRAVDLTDHSVPYVELEFLSPN